MAKKAEDFKTMTQDELAKKLGDLKKQQFNLRFQKSQGQLENTAQVRATRRDIARVRTYMGGKSSLAAAAGKKSDAPKAAKKSGGKKAAAKE